MRQEKEIPNGIILHLMEQEELCPEPKQTNELSLDQYKEEMAGVYTTSVNENTLDEAQRIELGHCEETVPLGRSERDAKRP